MNSKRRRKRKGKGRKEGENGVFHSAPGMGQVLCACGRHEAGSTLEANALGSANPGEWRGEA